MTLAVEFRGQVAGALAGPAERGLRIAARGRFDEGFQVLDQGGVRLFQERAGRPRYDGCVAEGGRCRALFGVSEFTQASPDGRPRQAGGFGHQGDAATLKGHGFTGSPMAAHPFVHQRPQQFKLAPHGFEQSCLDSYITIRIYYANRFR